MTDDDRHNRGQHNAARSQQNTPLPTWDTDMATLALFHGNICRALWDAYQARFRKFITHGYVSDRRGKTLVACPEHAVLILLDLLPEYNMDRPSPTSASEYQSILNGLIEDHHQETLAILEPTLDGNDADADAAPPPATRSIRLRITSMPNARIDTDLLQRFVTAPEALGNEDSTILAFITAQFTDRETAVEYEDACDQSGRRCLTKLRQLKDTHSGGSSADIIDNDQKMHIARGILRPTVEAYTTFRNVFSQNENALPLDRRALVSTTIAMYLNLVKDHGPAFAQQVDMAKQISEIHGTPLTLASVRTLCLKVLSEHQSAVKSKIFREQSNANALSHGMVAAKTEHGQDSDAPTDLRTDLAAIKAELKALRAAPPRKKTDPKGNGSVASPPVTRTYTTFFEHDASKFGPCRYCRQAHLHQDCPDHPSGKNKGKTAEQSAAARRVIFDAAQGAKAMTANNVPSGSALFSSALAQDIDLSVDTDALLAQLQGATPPQSRALMAQAALYDSYIEASRPTDEYVDVRAAKSRALSSTEAFDTSATEYYETVSEAHDTHSPPRATSTTSPSSLTSPAPLNLTPPTSRTANPRSLTSPAPSSLTPLAPPSPISRPPTLARTSPCPRYPTRRTS